MIQNKVYFAGIDLGSTMTKAVIIDHSGHLLSSVIHRSGAVHRKLAGIVMEELLNTSGLVLGDINYIAATGYGRMTVPFADRQISELSCHARGIFSLFPDVKLAIDVGGQDSKVMQIKEGKFVSFAMNDKCAAGTGRYLEMIAATLGLSIENLGEVALKSTRLVQISSVCTVFARQEVILHLSEGVALEDIVNGVHESIANRIARLAGKFPIEPDVVFTGGVAKNPGMVKALESNLKCRVCVPEEPLLSGALGAALLARESVLKAEAQGKPLARVHHNFDTRNFYS